LVNIRVNISRELHLIFQTGVQNWSTYKFWLYFINLYSEWYNARNYPNYFN